MTTYEKRKNDERRGFPWWLLIIGFILGAAVMLLVTRPAAPIAVTVEDNLSAYSSGEIEMTATAIADQLRSWEVNGIQEIDAFAITATTIIMQATQQVVMTAIAPSP